jgi:CheY-like chemotaxis protein
MSVKKLNVLLVDDDADDCQFFQAALIQLVIPANLTVVHDGEQLMRLLLLEDVVLPDVLFLDLNMPRKNGFECLADIKSNPKLKHLSVIVFSTSFEQEVVNRLYNSGAQYFIRKPSEFSQFKKIIQQSLALVLDGNNVQPARENFVLKVVMD